MYVVTTLYMATWLAPIITDVFTLASFDVGTAGLVTMLLCGLWPVGLFVLLASYFGVIGIGGLGVVLVGASIYMNKVKKA